MAQIEYKEIKRKVERDSRSELSKDALYKKLRKEYTVKNNVSKFRLLRRIAFSEVSKGEWDGSFSDVKIDLSTLSKDNIDEISCTIVTFLAHLAWMSVFAWTGI